MNRLKSLFIGAYPMFAMGIVGYAGWMFTRTGEVVWAAPLLGVLPFLVFLSRIMFLSDVARTSATFAGFNAVAWLGVGWAAVATQLGSTASPMLALSSSLAAAVGFSLYSVWYSRLGRQASQLRVGLPLPTFRLRTADGAQWDSKSLAGRPALVFFFRGNWCPLCMAQIKEVAACYRDIAATGTRVLFVSPQPQKKTAALSKRFDAPMDFLVDEGNVAARALGIEMSNGLPAGLGMLGYDATTVYPTVLVVDAAGVVRWLDETDNYRVRPEPSTFLPILRRLPDMSAVG